MILTRFTIRAGIFITVGLALGIVGMMWLSAFVLPPGVQIAYMRVWDYDSDIYLLDVATGQSITLVDNRVMDKSAAWSDDTMPMPIRFNLPQSDERYPDWSPDGKTIAFHSNFNSTHFDLYEISIATGAVRILPVSFDLASYHEAMATYSPDGTQIAFHAGAGGFGYNVYLTDRIGVDLISLTYGQAEYVHAAWSPDGERMALTFYSTDAATAHVQEQIYVLDVARAAAMGGAEIEQMELIAESGFFSAWSPDGRYLLYVNDNGGNRLEDIYRYDFETGQTRNLTINYPFYSDTHPDWTPDGRIVFTSDRAGDYDLYVMEADGEHIRRLTSLPGDELAPDWKP